MKMSLPLHPCSPSQTIKTSSIWWPLRLVGFLNYPFLCFIEHKWNGEEHTSKPKDIYCRPLNVNHKLRIGGRHCWKDFPFSRLIKRRALYCSTHQLMIMVIVCNYWQELKHLRGYTTLSIIHLLKSTHWLIKIMGIVTSNLFLTGSKISKSGITQWFLGSLYRAVLVFWCFKCVKCVKFCLSKLFQYRAFASPYKA